MLCLGVLAQCFPYVTPDLREAIRESVLAATQVGIPVNPDALEKGEPLMGERH